MDDIKDSANFLVLVAILVATVNFAPGFAVPGGFKSSDQASGQGMAILVKRKEFQVFIICDTVAMFCSIIATFTLLWVQFSDLYAAISAYFVAHIFTSIALYTMSVAFVYAVGLVVSELPLLASSVQIIGNIFLAILFVFHFFMIFPFGIPHPVFHFICHYTLPLVILFTRSYGEVVEEKQQKKSMPVKDDKLEELQEMKEDKQLEK